MTEPTHLGTEMVCQLPLVWLQWGISYTAVSHDI